MPTGKKKEGRKDSKKQDDSATMQGYDRASGEGEQLSRIMSEGTSDRDIMRRALNNGALTPPAPSPAMSHFCHVIFPQLERQTDDGCRGRGRGNRRTSGGDGRTKGSFIKPQRRRRDPLLAALK